MATQTVTTQFMYIPSAPAVPALAFRRFRGASDYPAMANIIRISNMADRVEEVTTTEDIARQYAHLSNCDPYQDMLFAEANGEVIGYNRVTWWKEGEGNTIYFHFGFVVPEWRQKGIGRAMLCHSERRLLEIAADHPKNGPRLFQTYVRDSQPDLKSLLGSLGYSPVRHFYEMVREDLENIPEAPLPQGLEVRPVEPEHYQMIWDANQEAFRDHWGHSPSTEEDYQLWLKSPTFDPSLWQVAWDGDQVAGMVLNFIDTRENIKHNRRRGYTEDICVRRPWRRRGLARALLTRSFRLLKERGMTEAALGVDTENPSGAFRLYESVGFSPVRQSAIYRKPMIYTPIMGVC